MRRARRVHPYSRPSGAPFGMDAASALCESLERPKWPIDKENLQTPKRNLISAKSGPDKGVHFKQVES